MKAKVTGVLRSQSKHKKGTFFYYIFFRDAEGKCSKTCATEGYRNFPRWRDIIAKFNDDDYGEIWLDKLNFKARNLVDADSYFEEVKNATDA